VLAARRYVPVEEPRATVVLAHGFAAGMDHEDMLGLAARLCTLRLAVVLFDFRGHGRSAGSSTVGDEERLDVAAAVGQATRGTRPVVLVGVSMGAIASLGFAAEAALCDPAPAGASAPLAGLVLVSAPASWRLRPTLRGMAALVLTRSRLGVRVARRRLGVRIRPGWALPPPPASLVPLLRVPLAVVHGSADRLLKPLEAERLYREARPPRWLEVVPGMRHGVDRPVAREAVARSVEWVLAQASDLGRPTVSPTTRRAP
jgi:alpha-beta hydrolase superfamily lysophospholipase